MSLLQELIESRKSLDIKKAKKDKKKVQEWAGDKYDDWHAQTKPNDPMYTQPEETSKDIQNKIAALKIQKKQLEDKRKWREAQQVQDTLSKLDLKLYKMMSVKESAVLTELLGAEPETASKEQLELKISNLEHRQRQLRNAGDEEAADKLNFGLQILIKRLRATGPVHKHNAYAHYYHSDQVYEGKESAVLEFLPGPDAPETASKEQLELKISNLEHRQRQLRNAGDDAGAEELNFGLHQLIKRLRATGPVHKHNAYAHYYHPHQVYEGEEIPVAKKAIKRKKKIPESKKLKNTLLCKMLSETRLCDSAGMEHLKKSVKSEEAHRLYTHLSSSNSLTPEEQDELDAIAHSKTKAAPDPVKKLEWELHQAQAQQAHHIAHLNRGNGKLNNPDTSEHIKHLIKHLTVPEQHKALGKLDTKIAKIKDQINQLKN